MAKKARAKKAAEVTAKRKFVFRSKVGGKQSTMDGPTEGNGASKVLWDVITRGKLPDGLKLQFAPSYGAYFINRKGKNACGFFSHKGLLVVNGIAEELSQNGYKKNLIRPEKGKKYFALRIADKSESELKTIATDISKILGIPA